jgi:hypothetical protein
MAPGEILGCTCSARVHVGRPLYCRMGRHGLNPVPGTPPPRTSQGQGGLQSYPIGVTPVRTEHAAPRALLPRSTNSNWAQTPPPHPGDHRGSLRATTRPVRPHLSRTLIQPEPRNFPTGRPVPLEPSLWGLLLPRPHGPYLWGHHSLSRRLQTPDTRHRTPAARPGCASRLSSVPEPAPGAAEEGPEGGAHAGQRPGTKAWPSCAFRVPLEDSLSPPPAHTFSPEPLPHRGTYLLRALGRRTQHLASSSAPPEAGGEGNEATQAGGTNTQAGSAASRPPRARRAHMPG